LAKCRKFSIAVTARLSGNCIAAWNIVEFAIQH
jgi:hypothetical protein